ncbi:MAG: NADPH-dependent F420 reductase [Armatimonadota bacterium]|nr:NADPH-dependent F420 reductase [Armatimonadota bacterium]
MRRKRIAIIGGTGQEGFGLALRWARAGHRILIGSRSPHRAEDATRRLLSLIPSAQVQGLPNEQAAEQAEIVVLTIPYSAQGGILPALREAVRGKIVVDVTVPLLSKRPLVVDRPAAGSAAERAKQLLGEEVQLVSGFHTVSGYLLSRLDEPLEGDVLICGDAEEAKQEVIALAQDLGARGFNVGPLRNAGVLEHLGGLLIGLNLLYKRRAIGIKLTGI